MSYVGLYIRSSAPNGTLSPRRMVHLIRETGLSAIAFTDHNTTAGVAGAAEAGAELGLEVVPGIEVPSSLRSHEVHILGLFVDTGSSSLQAALKEFRHHRDQHNQKMLGRFDTHSIHLAAGDLCAGSPDMVIARAHVARALLVRGLGPDLNHIFKKYLQYGGTYYPSKEFLPLEAVMEALLGNHTFAVLAHPFQCKLGDRVTEELITYLMGSSMKGLEVYHSSHGRLESTELRGTAARYHLFSTDDSDFRDGGKPDISIGTDRGGLWISSLLLNVIRNTL